MRENAKRTAQQWIELLSKKELPAITSVAAKLDKISNDDISSIPQLSKIILHDQGLSSCVLKVANSANRISNKKVTTVSRASIVLGTHAVKNICLTSKILQGLLESENLGPEVHDRLTTLMANAFHAGLLAKMMLPNYSYDTQEEVYLAAMLYHIGETSFWSSGSKVAKKLIKQIDLPSHEFEQYCDKTLGVKFKNISIGLAQTWHLGELLIKSLDQPESRATEMQIISLSNQLSTAISSPTGRKDELDKILKNISRIMDVNILVLKERIEEVRCLAIELLSAYGASTLKKHIKKLPKTLDFSENLKNSHSPKISQEKALFSTLKELTRLTKNSKNINNFLSFTLKQLAQVIHFDRCTFWILSADKQSVESKISFNKKGDDESFQCKISLNKEQNIAIHVLSIGDAVLINNYRDPKWHNYASLEIEKLINNGTICFSPVMISNKTIGLISAQLFAPLTEITQENFSQFSFIIEHLNMCLSMVSHR